MRSGRLVLSTSECEEEQANEFAALQSIYWDCKIEDLRKKSAWNVAEPLELQISLLPSGGESNNENHVSVDLYIRCSHAYPAVQPYTELRNPVGLNDKQVKTLIDLLRNQAKSLVGEVMIHDLCSQVRSFLHSNNKPPKGSCYAEMMKTIRQKEQQKQDEQNKIEQEKQNNDKLQAETIKLGLKKKQEEFKKEKKKRLEKLESRTSVETKENEQKLQSSLDTSDESDGNEQKSDLRVLFSELDPDSRLCNDFNVMEKLGYGAFGDVTKVKNLLDGRFYAIKRIPLNYQNKAKTKKITQEVKLLSRLNHENVVRYYNSWIETSYRNIDIKSSKSDSRSQSSTSDVNSSFCGKNVTTTKSPNKQRTRLISSATESASDDSIDSLHDDTDDDDEKAGDSIIFQRSSSQLHNDDDEMDESGPNTCIERENVLRIQYLFIQMEFCDKSTLRDCIDMELFKDSILVWSLFREIVEGLLHIHDQGIIHRDLKPVNIFLDTHNHVKIGDFGLATVASKNIEHFSQDSTVVSTKEPSQNYDESLTSNVGTALYVSPEMMTNNHQYNQKVDLYSLGIIFFEMCYNPLTTGMERNKILSVVRQASIGFPDDFDKVAQPSQKQILLWLLNHDPSKRPTAKELLASDLVPLLPTEKNNLDKAIISAVKNINSHAHKNLMSTIFSQTTSTAIDFTYDYLFTKGSNHSSLLELSLLRQHVVGVLERTFKRHGAICFDVPTFMPHHNIYPNSCDEVLLMNKAGVIISLPYDSKVPFARYVGKRTISSTKRYSMGKIYRDHTIPELHPRELWECSFDIITPSVDLSLCFDAEVILIVQEIVNEFPGFADKDFQLKLNHINFVTAIMNYCGIPKDLHDEIFLVFREYKNINSQKSHLANFGINELALKKFFSLIQKEDSFQGISNFFKTLPKTKGPESNLVKQGLEYFKNLLQVLEACDLKFRAVISLKLCSNFRIYSGLSFQISRNCNKKLDVLATGGSYDLLLNQFKQLDKQHNTKRHGVGVTISLEKIISSVRSNQELNEGKSAVPRVVDLLVASTRPKDHHIEMIQTARIFWDMRLSCKLFDDDDVNLDNIKNYCKINRIPYLVVVDDEKLLVKIESSDKDKLVYRESSQTKFADFLRKRLVKDCNETSSNNKKEQTETNFSYPQSNNHSSYEVKLVGSNGKFKDSAKLLSNLSGVLSKFSNCQVVVLVVEFSKYMVKFISSHVEIKDEASFTTSITTISKEFPRERKHIQKLADEIISRRFRNNQNPVIIIYSFEDDFYKILI